MYQYIYIYIYIHYIYCISLYIYVYVYTIDNVVALWFLGAERWRPALGADVRLLVERPLESPPHPAGRAVAAGAGGVGKRHIALREKIVLTKCI